MGSVILIVGVITMTGCSRSSLTVWATKPVLEGGMKALLAETDIELARAGFESELKLLEGLLAIQPEDKKLLGLALQGFTGYAMMFLEDENPERAIDIYDRAVDYGMQSLFTRDKRFLMDNSTWKDFNQAVGSLENKDISVVYWTAVAWAGKINLTRSSPSSIADSPRVSLLMQWVYDRDPHYYYSGPLWYYGTYYSTLPPLMGGSAEQSLGYFQRATERDGERFLWGKLLFARYYAVQSQNQELFIRLLSEVINGSEDEPGDLKLLNRIAAHKASRLIQMKDELF